MQFEYDDNNLWQTKRLIKDMLDVQEIKLVFKQSKNHVLICVYKPDDFIDELLGIILVLERYWIGDKTIKIKDKNVKRELKQLMRYTKANNLLHNTI